MNEEDFLAQSGKPKAQDSVTAVVDSVAEVATGKRVAFRDLVESLGQASFVPVLMAPALAVVTPLSGVPLVSSFCGILIALVSAQMLFNRSHLWLPEWLMRREIPGDRLRDALGPMRKGAGFLDRWSKERLHIFVRRPFRWITELACLICGAVMPALEFVPFSSSILGAAVVLFSLSLLVKDGLLALLAFGFVGGAVYTVWSIVGG